MSLDEEDKSDVEAMTRFFCSVADDEVELELLIR